MDEVVHGVRGGHDAHHEYGMRQSESTLAMSSPRAFELLNRLAALLKRTW